MHKKSRVVSLLDDIRNYLSEQEDMPVDDLDTYLSEILDSLVMHHDLDDETAIDFLFSVIDAVVASGDLPEFPEDGASEDQLAAWLGAAKTYNLAGYVVQAASGG